MANRHFARYTHDIVLFSIVVKYLLKEFQQKGLNNEEYVKVLYRTFFDREYDKEGLDYWLGQLAAGKDRDYVLNEFANSKEFAQVKAAYGL